MATIKLNGSVSRQAVEARLLARSASDFDDAASEHDSGLHFQDDVLDGSDLSDLDLTNAQFGPSAVSVEGGQSGITVASCRNTVFRRCALRNANFSHVELEGASFEGADIEGATFAHANLEGAIFGDVIFPNGDLMRAKLSGADLCDAHLSGALLVGADLKGADCGGSDLSDADLYDSDIDDAFFGRAQMSGANLCDCRGKRVLMPGATLVGAKIAGANLPGTNLHNANLAGANLNNTVLTGSTLIGVILRGSSLRRLILNHSNCYGADLSGADLRGAKLDGCDLRQAILNPDTQLQGARFRNVRLWGVQWRGVDLTGTDLAHNCIIGDERSAKQATLWRRARLYREAAEAYSGLASACRSTGLARPAVWYHYRSALMERYSLVAEFVARVLWQDEATSIAGQGFGMERRTRFGIWHRARRFLSSPLYLLRWLGSLIFAVLAGYGDKPSRALISYITIIVCFAAGYFSMSANNPKPLSIQESVVLSVTSFHGRGFANTPLDLSNSLASLSAGEAAIGSLVELLFVVSFTRRFIGA